MGLGSIMGTLSLLSLLFSSLVSFLFPSMHGNVLFENIYWELDDMGLGGGGGGRKGVERDLVCAASVWIGFLNVTKEECVKQSWDFFTF
jgi:hypothetical protein